MSLNAANFHPRHIEQAMTAVIAKGGDIVDILDWLCLNLPDGECEQAKQMSRCLLFFCIFFHVWSMLLMILI